ncbi:Alpha-acetolactate decarboxylase [Candidatus Magnetoovum chiemensis]|nr:Alpha-acetolactate decarboxylase [Candidatus Magnetoovum chiemensis]
MKNKIYLLLFLLLISSCVSSQSRNDTISQVSTISALMDGIYDGSVTYEELSKLGDFGLGTFQQLDGEMAAIDGVFYQIKHNGAVNTVNPSMRTPFAVVAFFDEDIGKTIKTTMSYKQTRDYITSILPSANFLYAIKIKGTFDNIKVRSVPAQDKPYPDLTTALKQQNVFDYTNIKGTLIGFWFPDYMKSLNVSGYHFHFLSDDKKIGGHVLDFTIKEGQFIIDQSGKFQMIMSDVEALK